MGRPGRGAPIGAAGGVAPTLAICTTLGNSARQEMGTTSCRVRARVLRGEVGGQDSPLPPASTHGCPLAPCSPQQQVEVLLLVVLEGEDEVAQRRVQGVVVEVLLRGGGQAPVTPPVSAHAGRHPCHGAPTPMTTNIHEHPYLWGTHPTDTCRFPVPMGTCVYKHPRHRAPRSLSTHLHGAPMSMSTHTHRYHHLWSPYAHGLTCNEPPMPMSSHAMGHPGP